MKIKYSIDSNTPSEFEPSLKTATQFLEDEIGPSASRVEARWFFHTDQQSRPCFDLELRDLSYGGELTRTFDPMEIKAADHLKKEFHSLWGDLLQRSATLQRQKVENLIRQRLAEDENGKN
jgi:hypothetical protein